MACSGTGPGPVLYSCGKSCANGIRFDVPDHSVEFIAVANHAIVSLVLPERIPGSCQQRVGLARGGSLDPSHYHRNGRNGRITTCTWLGMITHAYRSYRRYSRSPCSSALATSAAIRGHLSQSGPFLACVQHTVGPRKGFARIWQRRVREMQTAQRAEGPPCQK